MARSRENNYNYIYGKWHFWKATKLDRTNEYKLELFELVHDPRRETLVLEIILSKGQITVLDELTQQVLHHRDILREPQESRESE